MSIEGRIQAGGMWKTGGGPTLLVIRVCLYKCLSTLFEH